MCVELAKYTTHPKSGYISNSTHFPNICLFIRQFTSSYNATWLTLYLPYVYFLPNLGQVYYILQLK